MDDARDSAGELFLAAAGAGVGAMGGEGLLEFFRGDEGEILEIVGEGVVGLIEPELIEVEDAGFFGVEPDGVAFGFTKFATGNLINNERARIDVGFGIFEALDEVDARGAVAVLVGATELKVDVMSAEEVQEIVALNERVAEFGIGDAGAAFADAMLDELAVEQLGHAEGFADFTQEGEEFDVFEPVVVVEDFGVGGRVRDADNLLGELLFVVFDFLEAFEVAFFVLFGVADLTGGATDEIEGSVAMADEAGAHH